MRLLWRIYLYFLAVTLVALAATAWYADRSLRRFYQEQVAGELQTRAKVLAREVEARDLDRDAAAIAEHCRAFGRLTQARVTVVRPDGTVVGDSDQDPSRMENHSDRPEIAAALGGEVGRSVRFSDTVRRTLMYLAIPLRRDGEVAGAVRAAVPLATVDWTLRGVLQNMAVGGLVVAVVFAGVAFYLARRISRPLEEMRRTAEQLAGGDLRARAALPPGEEMQALARALNQMAAQLGERVATITRQNDEQRAVLASMVEGVLAVDGEGRVLHFNRAAERLLELRPEQACGRSVQEVVRNPELQGFIDATLAAGGPTEDEIVLYGSDERTLQLHGSLLTDADGRKLGALVVLHDITRLKRLERVRQDFVANVSHELKTPITALRGCVETLSEADGRTPEESERFWAMMRRQVDRLTAIVEDLLSLSRLEHDAEHKRIALEPGSIGDVLRRAAQALASAAAGKRITVAVDCAADLSAPINAALLEQAVGNLIDNAIKYSAEGTPIAVSGLSRAGSVEIRVADQGPGIEKRHLPRIFERFYRVDQARSRALGGTGLGLAIVKHIALAHGGSVAVESTPGQGSTFTLRIPCA